MGKNQIVQWVDRETVRLVEGKRSALVWVDVEARFFSRGRVIRLESITKWKDTETSHDEPINAAERNKIVIAVLDYFHRQRIPCRAEE
jgi:hypothetical protein